jgi:16S rRNA (uracil1498-N3)-methyltransferase
VIRLLVAASRLVSGPVDIDGDEHRYLGLARRARVGDEVELFDGAGRAARARVVRMSTGSSTLEVGPVGQVVPARPELVAVVPWIKGERMDWCVEKLVEVGAARIVVFAAARAVVQLDGERLRGRIDRLGRAAAAAARQAGRADLPVVEAAAALATVLPGLAVDAGWLCLPGAEAAPRCLPAEVARLAVVSGPEGGLTGDEVEAALGRGFAPIGLGPHILRAETAPVVAVALARQAGGADVATEANWAV